MIFDAGSRLVSYFGEIIPGLYVNELGNSNVNSQRLVAFMRVDSDGVIAAVNAANNCDPTILPNG